MNKETKYQRTGSVKLTIIMLLIYAVVQVILFLYNLDNSIFFNVLVVFNVFFVIYCLYVLSGVLKGKRAISKENKYLKKINPYIYFRELPNFFGIGVTTLLMDSTIENYKEWFNYCMQDGINIGLYTHTTQKNKVKKPVLSRQERIKKDNKIKLILSLILPCLVLIFTFSIDLILAIFSSLILFGISYFILTMVFNIKLFFREMFKEAKYYRNQNYINQLNNKLTRTNKGVDELHKLYSFKAFIKNFGHFVDKKPEEVVLWDRYLSYAQVFGLTKEIMESGYKELIDNSSFHIDSIDNINFNNIEVQQIKL